jgi:hypothetical protein
MLLAGKTGWSCGIATSEWSGGWGGRAGSREIVDKLYFRSEVFTVVKVWIAISLDCDTRWFGRWLLCFHHEVSHLPDCTVPRSRDAEVWCSHGGECAKRSAKTCCNSLLQPDRYRSSPVLCRYLAGHMLRWLRLFAAQALEETPGFTVTDSFSVHDYHLTLYSLRYWRLKRSALRRTFIAVRTTDGRHTINKQ